MTMRILTPVIFSLAAAVPANWHGETTVSQEHAYGSNPSQRMDFWPGKEKSAPVILYIHGGGWSQGDKAHDAQTKAAYFTGRRYAFASMNYRLVPHATVEQQAADVANAVAWLRQRAGALGIDRRRIVLMGHSAGAHLAALVATDLTYLKAAGVPAGSISGVVLLDGAAFHVPSQLGVGGPGMQQMRRNAFGDDAARHLALSPVGNAAKPNAGPFLILHVNNPSTIAQSTALGRALGKAGTRAEVHLIANSDHMRLDRRLGTDGDETTKLVDTFLARVVR